MPAAVLRLLTAAAPDTPDAELLGRFAADRDEAAFAELVRRHGPAVHRVCRRLVGPSSADDAFQAAFLVLACRADRVRKAASVGSWLVGVAGRVGRQMRRQARRAAGVSDLRRAAGVSDLRRAAGVSRLFPDGAAAEQPPDGGRSPEVAELSRILADELARLPDVLRDPVVLCLVEGRTQEEAAAAIGGSVRTLRRRLDRARAVLRARLEGRGVVPVVAAGAVAALAPEAGGLPPRLADRVVNGVSEFLAGGRGSPAAVVANGVVGTMTHLKATSLVAAAAVAVIGLGVGLAQDNKPVPELPRPAAPPPTLTLPLARTADPDRIPPPAPKPVAARPAGEEGRSVHRSPNFLVEAPTPAQARALAAEAEFQRRTLAVRWLGNELPPAPDRCVIRYKHADHGVGGSTTFTYEPGGRRGVLSAEMSLTGPFPIVLETELPHEVMHTVMAGYVGRPLPRWADEGLAQMAEPPAQQAATDIRARELLNAGRGIRLRALFPMTEYPRDTQVLFAQGHSVVRFLLTLEPKALPVNVGGPGFGPALDDQTPEAQAFWKRRLGQQQEQGRYWAVLEFVRIGMDGNRAAAWNEAAKAVYGFYSVDALEEAWLAWLKDSKSVGGGDAPAAPARPGEPAQIPPTKLPGGEKR